MSGIIDFGRIDHLQNYKQEVFRKFKMHTKTFPLTFLQVLLRCASKDQKCKLAKGLLIS